MTMTGHTNAYKHSEWFDSVHTGLWARFKLIDIMTAKPQYPGGTKRVCLSDHC